jgi:hypothetical protein
MGLKWLPTSDTFLKQYHLFSIARLASFSPQAADQMDGGIGHGIPDRNPIQGKSPINR